MRRVLSRLGARYGPALLTLPFDVHRVEQLRDAIRPRPAARDRCQQRPRRAIAQCDRARSHRLALAPERRARRGEELGAPDRADETRLVETGHDVVEVGRAKLPRARVIGVGVAQVQRPARGWRRRTAIRTT